MLAFVLSVITGLAQPTTTVESAAVDSWFQLRWAEAKKDDQLHGLRATWREESGIVPTAADIAALSAEVHGKPDHPKRVELRAARARRDGKEWRRFTVWARGSEEWRMNEDFADGQEFQDIAATRDRGWVLGPSGVTLLGNNALTPNHVNIRSEWGRTAAAIDGFLSGGLLPFARFTDMVPAPSSVSGPRFVIEGRGSGRNAVRTMRAVGRWDVERGQGLLERIDYSITANGSTERGSLVSSGHRWSDTLGRYLPAETRQYQEDRLLFTRSQLQVEPFDLGEFDVLLRTPSTDGTDVLRGDLRITRLRDYSKVTPTDTVLHPDGTLTTAPVEPTAHESNWRQTQWFGWAGGIIVVVGLVLVRLVRARATSSL
ncbi:MAG: hypothetical protein ACT4PL_09835 [Phycisphaerales bacterium]